MHFTRSPFLPAIGEPNFPHMMEQLRQGSLPNSVQASNGGQGLPTRVRCTRFAEGGAGNGGASCRAGASKGAASLSASSVCALCSCRCVVESCCHASASYAVSCCCISERAEISSANCCSCEATGTFEPKLLRTELFSLLVRLLQVVLLLFLPLMMLQFLLRVLLLCC